MIRTESKPWADKISFVNRCVFFVYLCVLISLSSCVDPYRPPEIASPETYLVVNGYFDSTPGAVTTISLSRSQNLADPKLPPAETKAQVSIESDNRAVYPLQEGVAGTYTLTGVSPVRGQTYRLRIKTAGNTEYVSDYVSLVATPPIDSVSWRTDTDGLQINVNAHDPTNNTRYYRWDFQSTWEYTTLHNSLLELKGTQIVDRLEPVFRCWSSDVSTNIITTSTARLNQDRVSQFPLLRIPASSVKLGAKYSILVRQIGLTKAGFDYYDQLAKITQNIGSIFDPQPTQITGNIHPTTDTGKLALGFFRVGSVASKRIFISRAQLPGAWRTNTGLGGCQVDTLTRKDVLDMKPTIINAEEGTGNYFTTSLECADCRARGGVTKQPDFWK